LFQSLHKQVVILTGASTEWLQTKARLSTGPE